MLARRLLARVLPHSLAASWLEESEQDRNPVLPQGREAAVMRVALHEKTARVRARQGALELRERELAASECVCPRLPFSSIKHARSKARTGELTGGPPVRWFVIHYHCFTAADPPPGGAGRAE